MNKKEISIYLSRGIVRRVDFDETKCYTISLKNFLLFINPEWAQYGFGMYEIKK